MRKVTVCDVVDKDGKVICIAGMPGDMMSKVVNGPLTHIRVGYYKDVFNKDTYNCSIYPLSQVYFYKIERE